MRSSGRRNRSAPLHRALTARPRRRPHRRCGHHWRRSGRHRSDRGPGATAKASQDGSGARCDRRGSCGRRPISCTDAWQVRLFVYTYYDAPKLSRVSRGGREKAVTGLFFEQALLPQGWAREVRLALDRGRLVSVEAGVSAQPGDERHRIGLPGMPNLHSHAFQRGMAGLTEIRGTTADSFWTWRDLMYRFVGRMTADDIEAVAAQAYVEMLEAGFTRVGEFHYIHHDVSGAPYSNIGELAERIAAAAQASGIGLTLLPVFYAHAGFGGRAPDRGQHRFINDVDGFARLLEASRRAVAGQQGAVVGLAPHSLRAVTPEELTAYFAARSGWSRSYPYCRTNPGSRRMPRMERPAAIAMAVRPRRGRSSLVPDPCDPRHRRGASPDGGKRGGGRIVPGHRGQSRRRNVQRRRNSAIAVAYSASARIPTS